MHSSHGRVSFLLLHLCCLRHSAAIINRPAAVENDNSKQLGNSYLNQQRPLWILEDQVPQSDYTALSYTTPSPYGYRLQQAQQPQQSAPRLEQFGQSTDAVSRQLHAMPLHLQQLRRQRPQHVAQQARARKYSHLPRHYLPLQRIHFHLRQRLPMARKQPRFIAATAAMAARRRERYIPHISMPTFDSMPGDESVGEAPPIFIYTGPKGKLIMNTLFSAPKYPMQEPVPGQVLYPPSVPIFRPKPIVERFRMPGSARMLNLTLIPFYAHDAIDTRQASRMLGHEQQSYAEETTTMQPTVLYAAPAVMPSTADSAIATSNPPVKKFRAKKAKHYTAYHSPKAVQWTPLTSEQLKLITSTTTPFPLTVPSPLQNHRIATAPSFANYKISYKTDAESAEVADEKDELLMNGDQREIIYVDDSLEKPGTAPTKSPLLSSRYALSNEYYAFPVFTLGKLLKTEALETQKPVPTYLTENTIDSPFENAKGEHDEQVTQEKAVGHSDSSEQERSEDGEADVETWFVLNSRYKGQSTQKDSEYRLSSKYIHPTDVRESSESNL